MKIGYARVSSACQSLDLQIDALKAAGCEKIYEEKVSGAKIDRPVLDALLGTLRPGDCLVIWKLDRLSRSLSQLISLINGFVEQKIDLISLRDPVNTTTASGMLIFNIFASLAEFERSLLIERTQAGVAAARARGKIGGRPIGLGVAAVKKARMAVKLYQGGGIHVADIAKQLGISKTTLYSYLRFEGAFPLAT